MSSPINDNRPTQSPLPLATATSPTVSAETALLKADQSTLKAGQQRDGIDSAGVNNPFAADSRRPATERTEPDGKAAEAQEGKKNKSCGGQIKDAFKSIGDTFKKLFNFTPVKVFSDLGKKIGKSDGGVSPEVAAKGQRPADLQAAAQTGVNKTNDPKKTAVS